MVQLLRLLDVNPLDILPQRPPFVMIDNLIRYDERIAATRLKVKENTMFVYDGELSAAGMIENMAQTCAARLGYYNLISGLPVKIGYIGAISGLHISRTPKVGEILETEIWPNMLYCAGKFNCKTLLANARLSDHSARGYRKLKIFFAPLFEAFDQICAQSENDLKRFVSVSENCRIMLSGNLKFDQKVPENLLP